MRIWPGLWRMPSSSSRNAWWAHVIFSDINSSGCFCVNKQRHLGENVFQLNPFFSIFEICVFIYFDVFLFCASAGWELKGRRSRLWEQGPDPSQQVQCWESEGKDRLHPAEHYFTPRQNRTFQLLDSWFIALLFLSPVFMSLFTVHLFILCPLQNSVRVYSRPAAAEISKMWSPKSQIWLIAMTLYALT